MKKLLYISIFIVSLCLASVLEPKDAFKITINGDNQSGVIAKFDIANGVYLYQDKIKIELNNKDITNFLNLPKAIEYDNYQIYRDLELFIPAGLVIDKRDFNLDIYYQGCSDDGFCYQPLRDKFEIKFNTNGKVIASRSDQKSLNENIKTTQNNQSQIASNLEKSSILWVISTFFIYGVLLSLTPCIFPMIPILSGLIVAKGSNSLKSGFIISLIYVLSMSVTYAIAGVIASFLGASIQGLLQTPAVLIIFSILFIILALSMFGLFEFEMPKRLQSYINAKSSKFGHISGVIFMGVTSALIVGPFGFIMLAMAIWVVSPLITDEFAMVGYAILGVILASLFGAFESAISATQRVIKAISIIIFTISIVVILDFSVNKLAPNLKPISQIAQPKNELKFEYVTNLKELKNIIKSSQTPLFIDFWASWCVNCKELENEVFTKDEIREKLNNFRLIKIDLSQNSIENQELMREYQIFGPPVLLIYNKGELKSQITGLVSSDELLKSLNQI